MLNFIALQVSWSLEDLRTESGSWVVKVDFRTGAGENDVEDSPAPVVLTMKMFDPNLHLRVRRLVAEIRVWISPAAPPEVGVLTAQPGSLGVITHYPDGWSDESRTPGLVYWRCRGGLTGPAGGVVEDESLSPASRATLQWLDGAARKAAHRHYNEVADLNGLPPAKLSESSKLAGDPELKMDLRILHGNYKSIGKLDWTDIPPFAVLTGVNGSGKTQLLEAIHSYLTRPSDPSWDRSEIDTGQVILESSQVVYVPSEMKLTNLRPMDVPAYRAALEQLYRDVRSSRRGPYSGLADEVELRAKKSVVQLTFEEFEKSLPNGFSLYLAHENVLEGLAAMFLRFRAEKFELTEREHLSDAEIRDRIGPPPWEVLNSMLAAAGFPYQVTNPTGVGLLSSYTLRLSSVDGSVVVDPADLSSGEKVLLSLVMWLYRTEHHNRFPQLLLLDEPDAHLHPSLTRPFLDALQTVLVGKYGVRVILTTHSPSTVALAPEGSVFEMRRTEPRVVRSESRTRTVAMLTAGLVTVEPTTRYVFVEDEDDAGFYSTVDELLREAFGRGDVPTLIPVPSVVFLSASTGKGSEKIGGGLKQVRQWVEKLRKAGMTAFFQGLIDRDQGNSPGPGIHVLQHRYSLENYLLDPLVVYSTLLAAGHAPALRGVALRPGDEHQLRGLPTAELQRIADEVLGRVALQIPDISPNETELERVEYIGGPILHYPRWLLGRRGKELLQIVRKAFEESGNTINIKKLQENFRRLRMVPGEFVTLLNNIRTDDNEERSGR